MKLSSQGTQRKRSAYGRKSRRGGPTASSSIPSSATNDGNRSNNGPDGGVQSKNDAPVVHKQGMCIDILTEGYVQSFVDFFYLMHRPDPNPDPNKPEAADAEIAVPVETMQVVKENLTSAEAARRSGETSVVYNNYNELARGFQESNDAKTGIYFFEKCLEIARLTSDPIGEMKANHNLGLAYQRLDNMDMAIKYHTHHRDLVMEGQTLFNEGNSNSLDEKTLLSELSNASYELNKMYKRKAEKLESSSKLNEAISLYELSLEAAKNTNDAATIGQANYRLGRSLILADDPSAALSFLELYRDTCLESNDRDGQGQAFSALAAAYQKLNQTDDAVSCLREYLKIAKDTDDLTAQAEACCNLGVIHNRKGEFSKAVHFFERNFEISRSIVASGKGTRRLVDNARVNLGMSRGNAQIGTYMNVISYDISSLLLWKNRRLEFDDKKSRGRK
jgi:tetratricopeptide (TPR) repeat protein